MIAVAVFGAIGISLLADEVCMVVGAFFHDLLFLTGFPLSLVLIFNSLIESRFKVNSLLVGNTFLFKQHHRFAPLPWAILGRI